MQAKANLAREFNPLPQGEPTPEGHDRSSLPSVQRPPESQHATTLARHISNDSTLKQLEIKNSYDGTTTEIYKALV
jgi:hypothetical protein